MWDVEDEEDGSECVDRGQKLRHTAESSGSSSLSLKSDRSNDFLLPNFRGPSSTK
ncbi:unnamed protein product [Ophioblennius macclurei]